MHWHCPLGCLMLETARLNEVLNFLCLGTSSPKQRLSLLSAVHQVVCGGNGVRFSQHIAIRDVVFRAAHAVCGISNIKSRSLILCRSHLPGQLKSFSFTAWCCGDPATFDVHIISSVQQRILGEAASAPDHALQVGVISTSYFPTFQPIALAETLGGPAEGAIFTIGTLSQAIGQRGAS